MVVYVVLLGSFPATVRAGEAVAGGSRWGPNLIQCLLCKCQKPFGRKFLIVLLQVECSFIVKKLVSAQSSLVTCGLTTLSSAYC